MKDLSSIINERNKLVKRDTTIDAARGFAIILVVIGHSGVSSYWWNIIYFFHMPLFFFLSGCFLKPLDRLNALLYLKRLKWKELYKNFVLYSIIFLLASPVLYKWGFSNTPIISVSDFVERLVLILRFRTSSIDLLGQFWFLPVLFFVHALALFTPPHWSKKRVLVISFVYYFIGRLCFINGYKEPYDFSRILYFAGFYLLGYYIYSYLNFVKTNIGLLVISLLIIAVSSLSPQVIYESSILYYCSAVSGIFITIFISTRLKGRIERFISYIGKHTLEIFIFHCVSMKIIELGLSFGGFVTFSKGWSGSFSVNPYWWLYSIAGVAFPLLFLGFKSFLLRHLYHRNETFIHFKT